MSLNNRQLKIETGRNMRNLLASMYLKANLWRKYDFTFGKKVAWFMANEKLRPTDSVNLQSQLLEKILTHAVTTVPYYRSLFPEGIDNASKNIDAWLSSFPLLTRELIQTRPLELISEAIDPSQHVPNATGGSTGKPTRYFQDQNYQQYRAALELRNRCWTGWKYGEANVKIWGSSFDVNRQKQFRSRLTNWLNNQIVFPAFDMRPETMHSWYEQLVRMKPAVLEGYVNALIVFADFLTQNRLATEQIELKAIITAAEPLLPEQRELLRKTFHCKVYDRYGSRELACIAHECACGRLHINEDWVHVEVVDETGKRMPDGELGLLAITSYQNFAMPFIRYIIEDVGAFPKVQEPCPCGMPFRYLERLEGRMQSIIALPGGHFITGLFFPHLFKEYDVKQFQVIQNTLDQMDISIVTGNQFNESDIRSLKERLAHYFPGIHANIDLVDKIPLNPSGKFCSVISNVANPSMFIHKSTHDAC